MTVINTIDSVKVEDSQRPRLPEWLKRSLPHSSAEQTHDVLSRYDLNTVCESAKCPNRSECYSRNTATFMILGNSCTRSCGFCSVPTGKGEILQETEPKRVAQAAKELGLEYVVITSVARDDLKDEGSEHFADTIRAVYDAIPGVKVEVLTPDFHARPDLIRKVVEAKPVVFNHNLETVKRLQKEVRPQASYERSLEVLRIVKSIDPQMTTKSGLMLGLGETEAEILEAARDLRDAGCDILTLGQYLAPGGSQFLTVKKFYSPLSFNEMADLIRPMGFREVFSGSYIRSSYHAGETFKNARLN